MARLPEVVRKNAELANNLIAQRAAPTGNTDFLPDPAAPNVLAKEGARQPAPALVGELPPIPPTNPEPQLDPNAANPYAIDPADLGMPPEAPLSRPVVPVAAPEGGGWEHKYSVLQGMYDADRTAWSEERNGYQRQLNAMVDRSPDPLPAAPLPLPTVDPANPYGVPAETVEAVGEDLIKVIGTIARNEVGLAENRFKHTVNELSAAHRTTVEDIFYSELDTHVPDWRSVNVTDAFKAWLGESDGMTGRTRQEFLQQAYDERNAPVVIRYFTGFKASTVPPAEHPDVLETITPNTIPGGGPELPTGPGSQKVMYTPESIRRFYKDKGLGKFRNNPEEARRIEMDIFDAQREGRILMGRTMPTQMRR